MYNEFTKERKNNNKINNNVKLWILGSGRSTHTQPKWETGQAWPVSPPCRSCHKHVSRVPGVSIRIPRRVGSLGWHMAPHADRPTPFLLHSIGPAQRVFPRGPASRPAHPGMWPGTPPDTLFLSTTTRFAYADVDSFDLRRLDVNLWFLISLLS